MSESKYRDQASEYYKEKMLDFVDGDAGKIQGSVHGRPTSTHLMYKLDDLSCPGYEWMHYEFLIEYGIYNPSEGIYYGVKMISDPGSDHEFAKKIADRHWSDLMMFVPVVLNNVFVEKTFTHRTFRKTDNDNDNTYWPFWISLYEEEDIEQVALVALKRIRAIYAHYLGGGQFSGITINGDSFGRTKWNARYTMISYKQLLDDFNELSRVNDKKVSVKPAEMFEIFVNRAIKKGWFDKMPVYQGEIGYIFRGLPEEKYHEYDFPQLMVALWNYIHINSISEDDRKLQKENHINNKISWEHISKIFIRPNGKAYDPEKMPQHISVGRAKKGINWKKEIEDLMQD